MDFFANGVGDTAGCGGGACGIPQVLCGYYCCLFSQELSPQSGPKLKPNKQRQREAEHFVILKPAVRSATESESGTGRGCRCSGSCIRKVGGWSRGEREVGGRVGNGCNGSLRVAQAWKMLFQCQKAVPIRKKLTRKDKVIRMRDTYIYF